MSEHHDVGGAGRPPNNPIEDAAFSLQALGRGVASQTAEAPSAGVDPAESPTGARKTKGLSRARAGSTQPPHGRWEQLLHAIRAADAVAAETDDDVSQTDACFDACELAAQARQEMWRTCPPNLNALADKLEQAMILHGIEEDHDEPMFWVLLQLRDFADGIAPRADA
ncbi:MAG TPA: hypothetical protein VFE10_10375 [Phenylobacterium sp.]|jgi:hypothetical protein|nr:hypothetical protein [Phenylobacterium sp.]